MTLNENRIDFLKDQPMAAGPEHYNYVPKITEGSFDEFEDDSVKQSFLPKSRFHNQIQVKDVILTQ